MKPKAYIIAAKKSFHKASKVRIVPKLDSYSKELQSFVIQVRAQRILEEFNMSIFLLPLEHKKSNLNDSFLITFFFSWNSNFELNQIPN